MPKHKTVSRIVERASALNGFSESKASVMYVLSSDVPELSRDKLELAAQGCNHCGTVFATQKDGIPLCVNCGSHDLDKIDNLPVSASEVAPDEQLASAPCPQCGTHNILAGEVLALFKGKLNCIQCGNELEFATEEQPPQGQMDVTETEELEEAEDDMEEQVQIEDQQQATQEQDQQQTQDQQQDASQDQQQVQDDTDIGGDQLVEGEGEQDQQDVVTEEEVQVSLLQHASADAKPSFAVLNGCVYAFAGDVPVAILREENASAEHKEVFHTRSFLEAIRHTATQTGLSKTLPQYGFKPITAKIAKKSVFDEKASSELAAGKKALAEATASTKQHFAECLSIAALGLNRNLFKGKVHPVKSALYSELESIGVRNPARLIDSVFANHGDSFNKVLLEQAMELIAKPRELRAELAAQLSDMNYQPVAVAASEEEDARGLGDPVVTSADVPAPRVPQNVTPISQIVSAAGGSFFRRRA